MMAVQIHLPGSNLLKLTKLKSDLLLGHINSGLGFPREYYMRVKASNCSLGLLGHPLAYLFFLRRGTPVLLRWISQA